jgi:hypothetical protein
VATRAGLEPADARAFVTIEAVAVPTVEGVGLPLETGFEPLPAGVAVPGSIEATGFATPEPPAAAAGAAARVAVGLAFETLPL